MPRRKRERKREPGSTLPKTYTAQLAEGAVLVVRRHPLTALRDVARVELRLDARCLGSEVFTLEPYPAVFHYEGLFSVGLLSEEHAFVEPRTKAVLVVRDFMDLERALEAFCKWLLTECKFTSAEAVVISKELARKIEREQRRQASERMPQPDFGY
jgi:hypothetical protein